MGILVALGVAALVAFAQALTSGSLLVGALSIVLFVVSVVLARTTFSRPVAVRTTMPDGLAPVVAVPVESADVPVSTDQVQDDQPQVEPSAEEPPETPPVTAPPLVRMPVTLDPDVVAMTLLESAAAAGQVVAVHLWLEDPSSGTLRQVSAVGSMVPERHPLPLDDEPLGRAVTDGAAGIMPLAAMHTTGQSYTLWRFALPVQLDGGRGVAGIDFSSDDAPDTRLLVEITATLRPAIAGSLALHVARTETNTARALVETARELSRRLDPGEVVSHALARAMALSEAASGSVMLMDAETGRMHIAEAHGLDDDIVRDTRVGEGEGIAGWVLATRKPVLVEDLPGRASRGRRGDIRSAVSVPIADEDGILGVLNVGSRAYPARFTDSHMEALQLLGTQTAGALRNAWAMTSARDLYFATLRALALALETKDPYARGGTERVVRVATLLGAEMGLDEIEQQALEIAALLHDIGMSSAGDSLSATSRPLSTFERGLLKLHPVLAAEILEEVPALQNVIPIVYHHHEWFDGTGYVVGLAGESIPLGARILAVSDAFVAMTSARPYREAMTVSEALEELTEKAGTQFDPTVVAAFLDVMRRQPEPAPDTRGA